MRSFFRLLIALPFVIIFTLFALTNRDVVTLGLWPFDYSLKLPLSIAVLVAMGIAFLVGAALVWPSTVSAQLRARRAESDVRLLEQQLAALKVRSSQVTALR